MKIIKLIGWIVLGLIAVVVVVGLIAPKDYSVERTVTINAPKELVFNHVKYWRNWQAWSPWAVNDPSMKVTVEGVDGTNGSVYKWVGDPDKTGRGEMTNTGIKDNAEISYHLHFLEPWESISNGYVRLSGNGKQSQAAWGFYGETPFPWNVMMLMMSMDKMIGKDFERGLDLLKTVCENEALEISKYSVNKIDFQERKYAIIRKEVSFSGIKDFYMASFPSIMEATKQGNKKIIGPASGLYYTYDEQNMVTEMAAALPVNGELNAGEVKTEIVPASSALVIDYYGPYSKSGFAHMAMDYYIKDNGLKYKSPVIEEYVTDPATEPDSTKWLTRIYYLTN